jgi:hypothetical protein
MSCGRLSWVQIPKSFHDLFQGVAGKTIADDPVTFGDLWRNGRDECAERDIDLVLMTTNATRGVCRIASRSSKDNGALCM